ncbi:MAG: TadE/TadG family type IV pilus assembly protein [Hyphomonas sp.]
MLISRLSPRWYRKRRTLKGMLRNEEGISAVEFAFIAPVMLLIYFGCVELSFLMRADRKVSATAASLGDLTARLAMVTDGDLRELYNAAGVLMQPYPVADARMRITSVVDNGDGEKRVAWSEGHNIAPRAVNSLVTVPDGIVPSPGAIILTEVEYDYQSNIGFVLSEPMTMKDRFYLRPRRVHVIDRVGNSGAFGPS